MVLNLRMYTVIETTRFLVTNTCYFIYEITTIGLSYNRLQFIIYDFKTYNLIILSNYHESVYLSRHKLILKLLNICPIK
jgi:hypothetical protein